MAVLHHAHATDNLQVEMIAKGVTMIKFSDTILQDEGGITLECNEVSRDNLVVRHYDRYDETIAVEVFIKDMRQGHDEVIIINKEQAAALATWIQKNCLSTPE